MVNLNEIHDFFQNCFEQYGESPEGVGWNSDSAQEIRFNQLLKVIQPADSFSLVEYGCGYGHLIDYMEKIGYHPSRYYGVDILESAIQAAKKRYGNNPTVSFHRSLDEIPEADYLIASGVFNVKLEHDNVTWTRYIIESLDTFNLIAKRGFSVNFLTKYSDYDRMIQRPDLYYADPCFLFDYCKANFSRNVALLHDYQIYDFTIIVRKEFPEKLTKREK